MHNVTVFIHKEIYKQIQSLYQRGGNYQKASEKCKILLYDLKLKQNNPIEIISKIPMTNHGESRIQHCVKYDLSGYCRIVTIQDNGWLVLLYCGMHDEVDKWLEKNRGLQVAITDADKGLFEIYKSEDINDVETRINPEIDYSGGKLYAKLKQYWDIISAGLPSLIKKILEKFETITDEEEILEVAMALDDRIKQEMVFDVFMLLRGGMVDEAKKRILDYQNEVTFIKDLGESEIKGVKSNDQYLNMDDIDEEDLKILMNNKSWLDWMLFMHPAQKEIVEKDFTGSARLLGVSGSGKTCIIVKRSVRLAKKYPDKKILILTLNPSLSNLITSLISNLLVSGDNQNLKEQIEVKSFWELCRELIIELRNHEFDKRILGSKTDKHFETIDQIWEEYYLCGNNNNDASVLFPIHCSLLSRGVFPQEYIKQEFDWIRSFLPSNKLPEYLGVEREGRTIPLLEPERKKILDGLNGWENKMEAVGAIDYLGLTNKLYKYLDRIEPRYQCILVDEVQDFGTLELSIIRKLINEGENDLFLTGDIAQQVYSKHHKLKNAGIIIPSDSYKKILKNYRNSREILGAAYEMFKQNTKVEQYLSEDFEVLNPEYANFSSSKPFLRKANDLNEEFSYSIEYLNEILTEKEKGCIAICGY